MTGAAVRAGRTGAVGHRRGADRVAMPALGGLCEAHPADRRAARLRVGGGIHPDGGFERRRIDRRRGIDRGCAIDRKRPSGAAGGVELAGTNSDQERNETHHGLSKQPLSVVVATPSMLVGSTTCLQKPPPAAQSGSV